MNSMRLIHCIFVILVQCAKIPALAKGLFYIYEWPEFMVRVFKIRKFGPPMIISPHEPLYAAQDDLWPPAGATLHPQSGYDHSFRENNGSGRLLVPEIGLYQTWQFSLYKNLITRIRMSEYRTRNPAEATAFIIPFDAGVHCYIDHLNGRPRLAAPHGRSALSFVRETCNGPEADIFWKYRGHDHYVIHSVTAYQMSGMMVKYFYMEVCQNCTVITIETTPTKTALPGRTRKGYFAVPYPSSFHWHEDIKQLPWVLPENARDRLSVPERDILALFIGSVKPSQPTSRALRQQLHSHCVDEPRCVWHETPHACNGVVNSTNTMLLFRRAIFCPAPTGDSITRKSVFDALVAGCIPVLFSRASLSQYSWHVSEKDVDDVSVYISMKDINENNINFIDVLKAIPPDRLKRKQRAIASIAPRLQFAVLPQRFADVPRDAQGGQGSQKGVFFNGTFVVTGDVSTLSDATAAKARYGVAVAPVTWKPPFVDAVDIVIDKIRTRQTVEPVEGFCNEELMRQQMEQKEIMRFHADYAALRPNDAKSKLKDRPPKKVTLADVDPHLANTHASITFVVKDCMANDGRRRKEYDDGIPNDIDIITGRPFVTSPAPL